MESREFTEARNDPDKTKPVARTGRDVSGKVHHSIAPVTAVVFSRMRRNAEPRPKKLGLGRI